MNTFPYFSYGSNMLLERLHARCPSATFDSVATATGYSLRYWKKSIDGSGKATLIAGSDSDIVHGVIYQIEKGELGALDRAEGATGSNPGYQKVENFNITRNGEAEPKGVVTYLANMSHICRKLPPYDWYVALVLAGAHQNNLGSAYVGVNLDVKSVRDYEITRKTRCEALKVLGAKNGLAAWGLSHYQS